MRKRALLKRTTTLAVWGACALGWFASHCCRQTWQARSIMFEGLLARFSPAHHRAMYVEILQLDERFEVTFSRMRDRVGRGLVRESETRTGGRAFDELEAKTLH